MSDVVFIIPAQKRTFRSECCEGTLILATILREKGIDVDIYRFYEANQSNGFESFVEESARNILAKNPKIISFYCRCDCFLADIKIAERIKTICKEVTIVFGGPQAEASAAHLLNEVPSVDYCCSGEGENTIYPLFSGILNGTDVTNIEGLTYRNEKGCSVTNERPELRKSLDDLPFTDYSFVSESVIQEDIDKGEPFPLEVGRGCPYNCAYCSTSLFWKRKFRIKSSKRIIDEIIRVKEKYNVTKFIFEHDLFTANKKSVMEFCKCINESDLDITWACSSRIDTIDSEMIEAMAASGLKAVYFGIETGSPRMQEIIHKKLDIQQVINVCQTLIDNNINVVASFIYGFPEETEDDINKTLQLIDKLRKIGVKSFQLHLCAIFPGTEYYEKYRNELVFAQVYSDQVNDFGVRENYEFICEHKELFPFYYEYHSRLRDRFTNLHKYVFKCIELYHIFERLDKEKFGKKTLVELYLELTDASKDELESSDDANISIKELAYNYLPTLGYSDADFEKLKDILAFIDDEKTIYAMDGNVTEIRDYSIDIKAFCNKKELSEIESTPTRVIFRKIEDQLTLMFYPMV